MIKGSALALLIFPLALGSAHAQTPTGTIAGVVIDQTGAALADARVDIVNRHTGQTRTLIASADGHFSAAALPPGIYQITAEAVAFKRLERAATVEAGTTTTVDLSLEVGAMTERVTIEGVQPLIRHDHHEVGGLRGLSELLRPG
jgi:carboxypeptidase family protein